MAKSRPDAHVAQKFANRVGGRPAGTEGKRSPRPAVGQRGGLEAIRYLPPYSPDLNPIEQVFAKLKALLRDTAARATEALWAAVGRLLACFQPAECARYLAHCGYGRSG